MKNYILQRSVFGLATMIILLVCLQVVSADTTPLTLKIGGEVEHPLEMSSAEFKALPRVTLQARDHDGTETTYTGVMLWDIIARVKPHFGAKANAGIARGCLVVRAADKYSATFSLAEIHPEFTTNQIILADERDGKPLNVSQGPFQVIVTSDKTHARWVRQVISLEIVFSVDKSNQ